MKIREEIMKRFWHISLALLFAVSVFFGCEATQNIKKTMTSKVKSFGSKVDEELYAQVPEENREGVAKAEFNLKVFEEKVRLADLGKGLALKKTKYAGYELDLANNFRKESGIVLDITKLEAIQKSGLGEKEGMIEEIANLKSKKLKVEAERVKIDAKLATTKLHIQELTKQIEAQEQNIEAMNMDEKPGQEEIMPAVKEAPAETGISETEE